jgi:hypothetical protein
MNATTVAPKEEFFRTKLIPVGQLAELYRHHLMKHQRVEFSRYVFDNLGLVSVFAISPATPATKSQFDTLAASVTNIINLLREDLLTLNQPKVTTESLRALRAGQASIMQRLQPHFASLMATMEFVPEVRSKWLASRLKVPTPLTAGRRFRKWRTFVRNLDFDQNMDRLGLVGAVRDMPILGSSQGKDEAPALWRKCFDTVWTDGEQGSRSGPYLPTGVSVKSTSTGMLEVTHSFDPRQVVKKSISELPTVSGEIASRLVLASFSKVCLYTELTATMDEVVAWVAEQGAKAEATQNLIADAIHTARVDALHAKLASTFSPDELKLLGKVLAPSTASTAVKRAGVKKKSSRPQVQTM